MFDAIMRGSASPRYTYPHDCPIKSFVDEVAKDAANEIFRIRQSVKNVLKIARILLSSAKKFKSKRGNGKPLEAKGSRGICGVLR
jgi:hypothetical protein